MLFCSQNNPGKRVGGAGEGGKARAPFPLPQHHYPRPFEKKLKNISKAVCNPEKMHHIKPRVQNHGRSSLETEQCNATCGTVVLRDGKSVNDKKYLEVQ